MASRIQKTQFCVWGEHRHHAEYECRLNDLEAIAATLLPEIGPGATSCPWSSGCNFHIAVRRLEKARRQILSSLASLRDVVKEYDRGIKEDYDCWAGTDE